MTAKGDYFDADMGSVWVQPDGANSEPKLLMCYSTDGFEEPQGDVTSRLCRTTSGWKVTSRAQGAPGEVTFTLEAYLNKQRDWLQTQAEKRCPMPVYINMSTCGVSGTFLDYDFGQLGKNAIITSKSKAAMVRGFADAGDAAADATKATYEMSAEPGAPEYWPLVVTRRNIAEDQPLRDIAFCNSPRCLSFCGRAENKCKDGTIAADASAAAADVWETTDEAVTWAVPGAFVAPFAATEDVTSVVCFPMTRDITRILVGCGTVAAAGLRVAYSDDGGAIWTTVVVTGAPIAAACVQHGGGLFALDQYHIWMCTNVGTIYFSSDGGATWTLQYTLAAANILMAIHFSDENYGMCVGGTAVASGILLTTTDGGAHWNLGTSASATQATGVKVIDASRAWVSFGNGSLYCTWDFGTTWTNRTPRLPIAPTKLGDVDFIDEFCGATVGYKTVGSNEYAVVYRTFDGGYDWEVYDYPTLFDGTTPANFGLNSVWICDYNHIYSVGDLIGTTGLILDLAP
jgi:photosystem II stability/assembly factor-like uncharacterized protein